MSYVHVISLIYLFQNELPVCLPIFLERLRNEITRLTTVKSLTKIASSPLRIDLRPILVIKRPDFLNVLFLSVFSVFERIFSLQSDAVPILGSFLRKNQRALKLSTLVLLDTLVQNYSNSISIELLTKVRKELVLFAKHLKVIDAKKNTRPTLLLYSRIRNSALDSK